jgi:hypothetical protein
LLVTIAFALKKVAIYSALLLIFMFSFTIMGLELFSGNARVDLAGQATFGADGVPFDVSFDFFLDSLKSVFVILTNDNWAYAY